MAETRRGERLALGARGDLLVAELDPLDGDHAVQLLVVREPDDAEGAVAEAAHQPVAPERERRPAAAPSCVGGVRRAIRGLHHLRVRRSEPCDPAPRGRMSTADGKLATWRRDAASGDTARFRRKCGASTDHVLLRRRRADARHLGRPQARAAAPAARPVPPPAAARRPTSRRRERGSSSRSASALVICSCSCSRSRAAWTAARSARSRTTTATSRRSSRASNEEVSKPFFELLSSGDVSNSDLAVQVSQLRHRTPRRASSVPGDLDVPGDMQEAHQNVMLTLNLRAGGARARSPHEARHRAGPRPAGRGGDRADRGSDAGVPGLRRHLVAARGAADRRGARRRRASAGRPSRRASSCPATRGSRRRPSPTRSAGRRRGANGAVAPGLHGHGIISTQDRRRGARARAGLDDDPGQGPRRTSP